MKISDLYISIFFVLFSVRMEGQTDSASLFVSDFRFEQALKYLQSQPTNTCNLLCKASAYKGLGDFQNAISVYDSVLLTDTLNLKALIEIAALHKSLGNYAKSIVYFDRAIAARSSTSFEIEKATVCYLAENYADAEQICYRITAADSANIPAVRLLAKCFDAEKDTQGAIIYFEKVVLLAPSDWSSVNRLINLYIEMEQYNKGLALATNYRKLDSLNVKTNRLYAYLHYLNKDYTNAILHFGINAQKGDTSEFALKYLGISYFKLETFDTAQIYLDKAFVLDSADSKTCFFLGQIYARTNNPKGIYLLNKAIKLVSPVPDYLSAIYQKLSDAYVINQQYPEGFKALQYAVELMPSDTMLMFKIGMYYDNYLNDRQKALRYYKAVMGNRNMSIPKKKKTQMDLFYASLAGRIEAISDTVPKTNKTSAHKP